jgi:hypothetical protein
MQELQVINRELFYSGELEMQFFWRGVMQGAVPYTPNAIVAGGRLYLDSVYIEADKKVSLKTDELKIAYRGRTLFVLPVSDFNITMLQGESLTVQMDEKGFYLE